MPDPRPEAPAWTRTEPLGASDVRIGRIGLGLREIGRDPENTRRLLTTATDLGIRYLDTAATYGNGIAEHRLGEFLGDVDRDAYVVSTKVGQLLRPPSVRRHLADILVETVGGGEPGRAAAVDRVRRGIGRVAGLVGSRSNGARAAASSASDPQQLAPAPDATFLAEACDYSYDGVRRSLEESLERMGVDRVEIVYLHDPEMHGRQAIRDGYRALHRLRSEGTIGAIGVGMNHARRLAWFLERADFDVALIAGRYSLLDQSAATDLFPVARARRVSLVVAGVFNGGILADPRPGVPFDYSPASEAIVARAQRMRAICERHGVRLMAAALRFSLDHPDVANLLLGASTPEELVENLRDLETPIPDALWADLAAEGVPYVGSPGA